MSDSFIGLHLLYPAVAANVNSGESGGQKTTVYGGVRRALWSSQAQKRQARLAFSADLPYAQQATRTRRHDLVAEKLVADHGWDIDAAADLCERIWSAATGGEKGKGLVLTGADIVERAVAAIEAAPGARQVTATLAAKLPAKAKPEYNEAKHQQDLAKKIVADIADGLFRDPRNVTIGLHGRMMADKPELKVEAAVHVASGISVDPWSDQNIDYWTAVDDHNTDDTGAGNMGVRDRGTNLFYRYVSINLATLTRNIGCDRAEAEEYVRQWAWAFINAKPTRSISSTAPYADPILVAVHRPRNPLKLDPFFAKPITGYDQHRIATEKLLAYYSGQQAAFGRSDQLTYWTSTDAGEPPAKTEQVDTVMAVLDRIHNPQESV